MHKIFLKGLRSVFVVQSESMTRFFIIVMILQFLVSALIGLVLIRHYGQPGFIASLLGGGVVISGLAVFAFLYQRQLGKNEKISPERALFLALSAEFVKIVTTLSLLFLGIKYLSSEVMMPFFSAFIVTILMSSITFFFVKK